jgi:mono/diheme cytochrome c family protein
MAAEARWLKRVLVCTAAFAALAGGAAAVTESASPTAAKIDDFQLADQNYVAHHLYKMKDAKAVVLITYAAGDPVLKKDANAFMGLKGAYAAKGVEFLAIDSKLGETRATVTPDAAAIGLDVPILFDYQQLVGEGLNVTRAAEVIVIDPRAWTAVYRGPVAGASAAVEKLVQGQGVTPAVLAARGAPIAFPEKGDGTRVSYARDIAPIVQEKCAVCHQPGGIGPMQLTNYQQIRGFAPMIREVIRTQRMPPFGADQTVGHFRDDGRLTPAEIKTLVHWIEAGAPRGRGDDPLAKIKFQAPDWPLGKPDLIVEIPPASIPATGVMDYQRPVVPNVMTEGRWMRASTFRISDRQVVHHILTGVVPGVVKPGDTASETSWGASIGAYGPGRGSDVSPPDMGVWVPPSGGVAFQNHYTPYGKATVEKTQMGLYFYPKGQEPKYPKRFFGIFDFGITIPAGAEFHPEVAYQEVPKDMILYGLSPHAHRRGGSAKISIVWPNGKEELLLALPRYDFNWQYEYVLAEPLKVPAGSKIVSRWTYDNSTRNPDNPDPNKEITWGEQTSQEMLALHISYRWADETTKNLHDDYDVLMRQGQMFGVLDDNIDGRLQLAELRGGQVAAVKANFAALDANHDGALDKDEFAAAQKAMRGRGRQQRAAN